VFIKIFDINPKENSFTKTKALRAILEMDTHQHCASKALNHIQINYFYDHYIQSDSVQHVTLKLIYLMALGLM
jgi:hypothetical protein